ncbi:unnamed protein product [Onchocerca flexuosa]|uniref:Uncharacterized protein n=1 Tax=Onchocerca flexuosa TaxID=387005 RepID=A0A3P7YS87_9BILA|nr:unnamed protein product [Onchocerca flexuosa]
MQKKKDEQEEGNVDAKVNEKGSLTDCSLGLKWAYISAIQHLFKGWLIVLQNSVFLEGVLGYTIDFAKITIVMISSFMQTMFSVPFGDRQEASLTLPDREIFKEIMIKIGSFSSYYLDQMLPKIFTILADILGEFLITMDTGMKEKNLNMWQENMHWILLDIGHILVEEDKNRNCVWQRKLLDYYDEISEEGNDNIDICASYIDACVNTPQILTDTSDINLIIKIIGTVFAWCSIEDDLLKEYGTTAVNPKLCSTSLWCAKRLISAIGLHIQTSDSNDRFAKVSRNFTQTLTIICLNCMTCMDAIELLDTLAHTVRRETSKSIFLFSYLSEVRTDHLLVRTSLMKVLVEIGSVIDDEAKQRTLFEMVS